MPNSIGLSGFKNHTKKKLGDFVDMSITMTLIAQIMIDSHRASNPGRQTSLADLKTIFNADIRPKTLLNHYL